MVNNKMRQEIIDFIRQYRGGVSWVELCNCISGFKGQCAIGPEGENIFFWDGISDDGVDTVIDLLDSGDVTFKVTNVLMYHVDGCIPNAPLAKRFNHPYKTPHWLPVVLWLPEQLADEQSQ